MNTSRRTFLTQLAATSMGMLAANHVKATPLSPENIFLAGAAGVGAMPSSERKFVPVMLTPFTADLKIDFKALPKLIDFYLSSGAKGLFANCLSSEMYHLDDAERLALVKFVVEHVKGAVPVVATGSFGSSLQSQADCAKKMYETGVDGVILITSHFAAKEESDAVLMSNFDKFFKLTEGIPMGTYECPSPYKRILTPEVFRYLISTNRLVYHKDTTLDRDKIKVKLELCKNSNLEFYDAHTPNTMYSLQAGAKGMSCIAGNLYPEMFAWMCQYALDAGRQADVKWLQAELTRMDDIIGKGYSLSAKYFLAKRGLPIELTSRASKAALTAEQKTTLDGVFETVKGWHERLGIVTP